MTIQLDGTIVSTTMRTPGHDFELAVGFCHTEGLLAGAPVTGVRYCATGGGGDRVQRRHRRDRWAGARARPRASARRRRAAGGAAAISSTTCAPASTPLPATPPMRPERARPRCRDSSPSSQRLFGATGAVHAAAVFDRDGGISSTREDVGRHNAVDKLVGALLLAGALPADRARAVRQRPGERRDGAEGVGGGVRHAARGQRADRTGRRRRPAGRPTLAGFVRGDRFNVYAPSASLSAGRHAHRDRPLRPAPVLQPARATSTARPSPPRSKAPRRPSARSSRRRSSATRATWR